MLTDAATVRASPSPRSVDLTEKLTSEWENYEYYDVGGENVFTLRS